MAPSTTGETTMSQQDLKPCPFGCNDSITLAPLETGKIYHDSKSCPARGFHKIEAWQRRRATPTPGEAMEAEGQTPFMYVCPKCYHTAPEPIKHIAPADEQENMENGAPMEHCESDMIALYDRPGRDFAPAPLDGETPFTVDELAQEIRKVDGHHTIGAGNLAEALMPFLRSRLPSADEQGEG